MPIINKTVRQYKQRKHTNKRDNLNNRYVYNTRTWQNLRLLFLSQHPLCQRCQKKGKINSAVEVHHIVPISTADNIIDKKTLGFNYDNLESLCKDCHKQHHKFKPE